MLYCIMSYYINLLLVTVGGARMGLQINKFLDRFSRVQYFRVFSPKMFKAFQFVRSFPNCQSFPNLSKLSKLSSSWSNLFNHNTIYVVKKKHMFDIKKETMRLLVEAIVVGIIIIIVCIFVISTSVSASGRS